MNQRSRALPIRLSQRIWVVGSSGAGKSTTARALAQRLRLAHIELDNLHWGPDWYERPHKEFAARLDEALVAGSWVVDGNYTERVGAQLLAAATTVVWLDLPRYAVMRQLARRTLVRAVRRTALWDAENHESLRTALFDRENSVVLYAWAAFDRRREYFARALVADPPPGLQVIHVRSSRQLRRWLRQVPAG